MNNLWAKVSAIPRGLQTLTEWLGEGAQTVDSDEAQRRANICLKCVRNVDGFPLSDKVAEAIKRHVEVKNRIGLRVAGEKRLSTCATCQCCIRLLIWLPKANLLQHMPEGELAKYPENCWKIEP